MVTKLSHRRDIDGLRAIAVLSVFLYHLDVPPFGGGFVGVDLFFVVSGYLISRIILSEADRGEFSLQRFYERRIRRLFPAAIVTIIGILAVGGLWFSPELFKGLTQDAVATLVSVSNFYFWRGSHAYFANSTDPIPVLHFWSLAVEEQFYLFWPVFILLGRRLLGRALPLLILGIAILSLGVAQATLATDSSGAFYLPTCRAFEFAIGALVIFAEQRLTFPAGARSLLAAAGFALIAYAVVSFDSATSFPGATALIPCLGAACVILAGERHVLSPVLTNPLSAGIGLVSYSLYLVHWPLIVYANYILGDDAKSVAVKVLIVALAMALAALMYRLIEQPYRAGRSSLLRVAGPAAATIVALAIVAFVANRQDGWPWRLPAQAREVADLQRFGFWPCAKSAQSKCAFGSLSGPVGVQVLGDSFAEHYVAALDPAAKRAAVRGEAYTAEGCPLLVGLVRTAFDGSQDCKRQRDTYLAAIRQNQAPIVLSQSWMTYGDALRNELAPEVNAPALQVWRAGIENTIHELGGSGRRILIIAPGVEPGCRSPMSRFAPGPLWHAPSKPCPAVPLDRVQADNREFHAMLEEIRSRYPNQVFLLYPERYLCGEAECPTAMDGLWLYWDVNHLTVAGAQRVGDGASSQLLEFIRGK
ncbi:MULTISPECIES: acyltransferase family protein [unclassified Bradyrhizobium]|uniref:acyltransferase family protein n=1 Tax=unclassified Bradyrhizobium TaxID=2631580 RepID=UPI001CD30871|nr:MULTISPECIES: acyltransferase family protein [unclassified Bradyrhizobium]